MKQIKVRSTTKEVVINVEHNIAIVRPYQPEITDNGLIDASDDEAEWRMVLARGDRAIFEIAEHEQGDTY